MRINKGTYLFIILLFACFAGRTQGMSFRFAPIASSSAAGTISGGNPIILNGEGKCLVVSSGMSVLTIANNGKAEFGAGCKEVPPVAAAITVSLNLFPNPTSGPVTLKCDGVFDANLSCQVRILSMDGKMMMSQMVPMKDIKAGYKINAAGYAAGTYVVIMDFMNQRFNIKMVKL